VERRGAAIHVPNELHEKMKSIKGVGKLALKEGGSMSNLPPENCDSIPEHVKGKKRKHLHVLLNRGSALKERLVKEPGLGILFNPKIWWVVQPRIGAFQPQV
jgi:hypothetical protein